MQSQILKPSWKCNQNLTHEPDPLIGNRGQANFVDSNRLQTYFSPDFINLTYFVNQSAPFMDYINIKIQWNGHVIYV